jgi:putative mRNA 3-end processing factor
LTQRLGGIEILLRNGIELCIDGVDIYLDPKKARGVSFVSHAHSDHCPRSFSGTIIASNKTCALMRKEIQGECWHKGTDVGGVSFTLYDSGHIPGSSQLMIENGAKVLYSGDLNLKGGLITPLADTPSCDVLIIEATFGTPRYVFPNKTEVVREMNEWAVACNTAGTTPVFLGYSLGKAQELTRALSNDFTVFVEESIFQFNRRTEGLGIDLGNYSPVGGFSKKNDCVIIAPPHKAKEFNKDKYSLAYASGWAVGNGAPARYSKNTGFPLSDHSDFNGLIEFVEKVSPQAVYTVHGFAREFSQHLRERGFYSEPLSEVQTKLDRF